jgi:GNAT superfamily N-acetyltransferase
VSNRVAALLADAAEGRFPPPDGTIEFLPSPAGRSDAVVAFTGHNLVACGLPADEVRALLPGIDPYSDPLSAAFLHRLGERLGTQPGVLDAVLAVPPSIRPGRAELGLEPADASEHGRVQRAQRYRSDVRVYTADGGVLAIGRGLAGRLEVSIEVDPASRTRGLGRSLAAAALALAPPGEAVFAQVSPGNAASLRAFLAAGYRPIGSEVLFLRDG